MTIPDAYKKMRYSNYSLSVSGRFITAEPIA